MSARFLFEEKHVCVHRKMHRGQSISKLRGWHQRRHAGKRGGGGT
jgi:hypothetical protein